MRYVGAVIAVFIVAVAAAITALTVAVASTTVPEPKEVARAQATIVYWSDGRSELGRLGEVNRTDIPLAQVPVTVREAVLAAEDRDFYAHRGFSPTGITRAFVNNLRGGSMQGGSTITQQYAKNAFLTQEQTYLRKLRELILALRLETDTNKDDIFQRYLNTVYFGRGAYGIEAAAQAYFRIPAADLTTSQGAALAALLRAPSVLQPDTEPEALRARWELVLNAMVEQGWLTPQERAGQEFPQFRADRSTDRYAGPTGFLLQSVRRQLIALGYPESDIGLRGLRVVSTFAREPQQALQRAVRERGPDSGTAGLRVGAVAVDPLTGEIPAMYGGADYLTDQLNNATQAVALAGSTFKPFVLIGAFEQGIGLDTRWNGDSPRTFAGYQVSNYGGRSYGEVSLLRATALSINTVFVDLGLVVGPAVVAEDAVRAGLPADTLGLTATGALALGPASPTALDMATAYATFAAQGVRTTTTVIREVRGANGGVLFTWQPQREQVMGADVANEITVALQDAVLRGTGVAAYFGRPAAGKTGTSSDNLSAWFVGYTPQLVAAVMMVKEVDGRPVPLVDVGGLSSVTGGSFPARIWAGFMSEALTGQPVLAFPPDPRIGVPVVPTPTPSLTPLPTDLPTPEPPVDPPVETPTDPAAEPEPSVVPVPPEEPVPVPEPTAAP